MSLDKATRTPLFSWSIFGGKNTILDGKCLHFSSQISTTSYAIIWTSRCSQLLQWHIKWPFILSSLRLLGFPVLNLCPVCVTGGKGGVHTAAAKAEGGACEAGGSRRVHVHKQTFHQLQHRHRQWWACSCVCLSANMCTKGCGFFCSWGPLSPFWKRVDRHNW